MRKLNNFFSFCSLGIIIAIRLALGVYANFNVFKKKNTFLREMKYEKKLPMVDGVKPFRDGNQMSMFVHETSGEV